MYKSHCYKAPSKLGQEGVFTDVVIPAHSPIMEFRGDRFTRETLKHPMSQVIQIGHDTFLGPSGDLDDYLNHSCSPNCSVKIVGNRAILYSMYVIPADMELTFDYSTTSTDTPEQYSMQCRCGSFTCRGTISGYYTLDSKTQERFLTMEMLPLFLTNPMFV